MMAIHMCTDAKGWTGQMNDLGTVPFPEVGDRDKGAGDVDGGSVTKTDVFAITANWELDFATFTSISRSLVFSNYGQEKHPARLRTG
ncbi:MAG: hypothetical protein ACI9NT_000785 [Bacteroidia bacterium]|jgi:hypothetical protein